jgi:hypothetical protein
MAPSTRQQRILALIVEHVDEANRQKYEAVYNDKETGVTVIPVFIETGSKR